jgi:peptide/nickel transport system substrate-binding protein
MQYRLTKLRFRRRLRKGQKRAEDIGSQAGENLNQHFFKRFEKLSLVKRFLFAWLALSALLIAVLIAQNLWLSRYYQTTQPVPGGIYKEGVIGRFTTANPLFATSDADATVSRLVFAGLLAYDQHGALVPALANDWTVDEKGSTYTIHLKPNLTWQDGQALTSEDVLFTYKTIQNPDVQSPLKSAWEGIEVTAPDKNTVVFKLPGGLAAFPTSLTTGIVPQHLLKDIKPSALRSADFNTVNPVGAGAFKWDAIDVKGNGTPQDTEVRVALNPFAGYALGEPNLKKFVINIFAEKQQMIDQFKAGQLNGIEGLTDMPKEIKNKKGMVTNNLTAQAANMVFFKTSSGVLADGAVRNAIVKASNVPEVTKQLDYAPRLIRSPILPGQVAYDPTVLQSKFDLNAAKQSLDAAGWAVGSNGVRAKGNQKLVFTLTVANTQEYRQVAEKLKQQWAKAGVKVDVQYLDANDFQNALSNHSYEAILYGIAIGSDPDVFVYWDSTQADIRSANRLNLSEWKNPTADAALEAGRTRVDPQLRAIKYKPFLQEWVKDSPALALYQPRVLYPTNGPVYGLTSKPVNSAIDRFNGVQVWQIKTAKVTNPN